MNCPFCNQEMQKGVLSGDGRQTVRWKEGDKKTGLLDRMSSSGQVTGIKYTLAAFTVDAFFCKSCKKMIFDTDVAK